jgi:hypothetical protein
MMKWLRPSMVCKGAQFRGGAREGKAAIRRIARTHDVIEYWRGYDASYDLGHAAELEPTK